MRRHRKLGKHGAAIVCDRVVDRRRPRPHRLELEVRHRVDEDRCQHRPGDHPSKPRPSIENSRHPVATQHRERQPDEHAEAGRHS